MKKLLLFGGTTEGRLLAEQACALGWEVTLCVATEYGREVLPQELPFSHILVGRLGIEEMKLLMAEGFHQVVDATHPYAVEVSSNVRSAAQSTGLPHWRLLRQDSDTQGCCFADSIAQACAIAAEGNLLAATGSKEIIQYRALPNWQDRLFARVLPTEESVSLCLAAGLTREHILTGKGPFTCEQNTQVLKAYKIQTMVTKESGPAGGFTQKLKAAEQCGVKVIVLRRPFEKGLHFEQILQMLKEGKT